MEKFVQKEQDGQTAAGKLCDVLDTLAFRLEPRRSGLKRILYLDCRTHSQR